MSLFEIRQHADFFQNEARRLRLHINSGSDPSSPVSGQVWWRDDSPYKRIRAYDGSNAFSVPRTDSNATVENVGNEWNFDRGSSTPPFSAAATLPSTGSTATMVTNLNSNYLRGYLESATNTASTIALRDSNGRMQASDPSASLDVVNYGFMQAYIAGVRDPKDAARVATTANLSATRASNTLTASSNASINTAGIDGITSLSINDRVLVKNQSTGADNGVYIITDLGSVSTPWVMQRASDADSSAEVTNGLQIWITAGTANQQTGWLLTTADSITLNTTALTFIQVNGTAAITQGNGIVISGTTIHAVRSSAYDAGAIIYASTTSALSMAATFVWDNSNSRLGVGTASPSAKIHSLTTGEQARFGYDAGNYASFTVSSTGVLTIAPTGNAGVMGILSGGWTVSKTGLNSAGVSVVFDVQSDAKTAGDGIQCGAYLLNSSSIRKLYSCFRTNIVTATAGAEDGELQFWTIGAGSTLQRAVITKDGRFGVGTTAPSAFLHTQGTTEQFRIGYSLGVYASCTVSSGGDLTIGLTGSGKVAIPSITASRFVTTDGSNLLQGTDLFGGTNTWTGANTFSGAVIVPTPTLSTHAVTKAYVDAIGTGLRVKDPVKVATTAALPTNTLSAGVLTATSNASINGTGIDGVTTLALNDRVLVKNESSQAKNGIYYVSQVGDGANPWKLTRTTDSDTAGEITAGAYTFVQYGTTNVSTSWVQGNTVTTIDTDAIAFNLFYQGAAYVAGTGITISGLTISIDVAASLTWTGLQTLKNSAGVRLDPYGTSTGNTTAIRFAELVANGSSYVGFKAPDSITTSVEWVLPNGDGSPNQYLKTSGAGVLSFATLASSEITNTSFVTSVTGTSNRITSTGGLTPVIDISSAYVGQATITTLGTVATGTWNATTIAIGYGGTGLTSIGTANQLLGVNSGASGLEYKTVSGTANQITVTHGAGSITLATPQNIHSAATPTFSGLTLSGMTEGSVLFAGASGLVSQDNTNFFWDSTYNALGIGVHPSSDGSLVIRKASSTLLNLQHSSSSYVRITSSSAGFTIQDDTTTHAASVTAIGYNCNKSISGSGNILRMFQVEQFGTNSSGTTYGVISNVAHSLSNVGFYSVVTSGIASSTSIGFQADVTNNLLGTSAMMYGFVAYITPSLAFNSVVCSSNTFTGAVNGTSVYGTLNNVLVTGGTVATATAGYFHASGATANYSLFVNSGKIHIEPLSALTILQLDVDKNVISSNTLPAGTTIASVAVARGYAANIGDGSSTTITVTHSLATRDVVVQVRDNSSPYGYIGGVGVEAYDTNNVKIYFTVAPTTNQYRAIITAAS